jgi:hypothetical protein
MRQEQSGSMQSEAAVIILLNSEDAMALSNMALMLSLRKGCNS